MWPLKCVKVNMWVSWRADLIKILKDQYWSTWLSRERWNIRKLVGTYYVKVWGLPEGPTGFAVVQRCYEHRYTTNTNLPWLKEHSLYTCQCYLRHAHTTMCTNFGMYLYIVVPYCDSAYTPQSASYWCLPNVQGVVCAHSWLIRPQVCRGQLSRQGTLCPLLWHHFYTQVQ